MFIILSHVGSALFYLFGQLSKLKRKNWENWENWNIQLLCYAVAETLRPDVVSRLVHRLIRPVFQKPK